MAGYLTKFYLTIKVVHHYLFKLIQLMYAFVQEKLWWRINGINFLRENAIRCEDYDRAAHVLKIAWRFNMQPSIKNSVSDFITVHHSFVCPDVVLRDNITLYYIDMNKAVFIQTDEHVRI